MDKEEMQMALFGVAAALVLASCGLLLPLAAIGVFAWWVSGKGREDPPSCGGGNVW